MNYNDINITVDQQLSPLIYDEDKNEIELTFNYESNIDFTEDDISIIIFNNDILYKEIKKGYDKIINNKKYFKQDILILSKEYFIKQNDGSFIHPEKYDETIPYYQKKTGGEEFELIDNSGGYENDPESYNFSLFQASHLIMPSGYYIRDINNNFIPQEGEYYNYSETYYVQNKIIVNNESYKITIEFKDLLKEFKKDTFYKIQIKYDNYYSNIGLSKFINKKSYYSNIFFAEGNYNFIYMYNDTSNILNFYKYILKDENGNICQESDWNICLKNKELDINKNNIKKLLESFSIEENVKDFYNYYNLFIENGSDELINELKEEDIIEEEIGSNIVNSISNMVNILQKKFDQIKKMMKASRTFIKKFSDHINNLKKLNYFSQLISFDNLLLEPYKNYTLIIKGITNLGLEFETEKEIFFKNIYPIQFPADILLKNDFINGSIKVSFEKDKENVNEDYFNGNKYILIRSDENSNFKKWEDLTTFYLNNYTIDNFIYNDYTVQAGIKYKYGVVKINSNNLRSIFKTSANSIMADFEDIFLIDQDARIKIKYNPKISSYKTVKNENKIETIGSQYPFIMRNGQLGYKEIPISGLISFQMDENESYINNKEIGLEFSNNDLISSNVAREQKYKNYIMNWLNNNNYKLLKTATEGNFIVQIINVSLSPVDTLGRMLHTFSATAYEMDEYNYNNLKKYNIVSNREYNQNKKFQIESSLALLCDNNFNMKIITPNFIDNNLMLTEDKKKVKKPSSDTLELQYRINRPINQLYFFNFYDGKVITLNYDDNKTDNIYINKSKEYYIQNANKIRSFVIDVSEEDYNKLEKSGFTYSYFNDTINDEQFNDIQVITNKVENNFYLKTINENNKYFYKDNELINESSESNKNFIILHDAIIYPKLKTEYERDNSYIKIKSNNPDESYKNINNKTYYIPALSFIQLFNLENIESLELGAGLSMDVSYSIYEYN